MTNLADLIAAKDSGAKMFRAKVTELTGDLVTLTVPDSDPASTLPNIPCITSYVPAIDDLVVVLRQGMTWLVLGKVGGWTDRTAPSKGLLTNGAMHVWQRGTSITCPSGSRTFTADRWTVTPTGGTVTSYPTQWVALYPQKLMGLTSGTGVTQIDVTQRIPPEAMDGAQAWGNWTFWAYAYQANTAENDLIPQFVMNTADAVGDFSSVTNRIAATDMQTVGNGGFGCYLYHTFEPASYSDMPNGMEVTIRFPSLTAGSIIFFGTADITYGDHPPTRYMVRTSYGETLANCQRYYEQLGPYGATPVQYIANGMCTSTTTAVLILNYMTKRIPPTITFSAGNDFALLKASGSGVNATGMATTVASPSMARLVASGASGLVAGDATILYNSQDPTNAAIYIDAEL